MAYLVTGGTGYTGSYIVRDLLKQGKEVVSFQRSGITPLSQKIVGSDEITKVKIVQGDVSNTLQVFDVIQKYNIEMIIHTGYLLRPASELKPAYAVQVNCVGMSNLLEAVRLFGIKRLVWLSSTRALGRSAQFYKETMGDDDAIFMPDNFYGATKVMCESMAKHYFNVFNTDSIGLRMPLIIGYGKTASGGGQLAQLFREAALDKPVTIGFPDFISGFTDVEDVSSAVIKACDASTTKTRVFNITEGHYSLRQIGEAIRKINPKVKVTILEGEGGMITIPQLQPQLAIVDSTGAQTELGWKPRYCLEEAIRKVMNHFRQDEGLPPL